MIEQTVSWEEPLRLENGSSLEDLSATFHTSGTYIPGITPVIWVCHALTANSNVFQWWPGLFGPNDLFHGRDQFIVCVNMLGSPYGTTGPLSLGADEEPRYHSFPTVTVRDIVQVLERVRIHLGIERIHTLIGGSMGGQQALEWAIQQPELFENLVVLATNAQHSPWGIAFNESQRMAIEADPTWGNSDAEAGRQGLETARSIALLSYRTYATYLRTQSEAEEDVRTDFRAASYQRYQGEKLASRFDAFSYYRLSQAMDSHNVGRGRGGIRAALKRIRAQTRVLSMKNDQSFPEAERRLLAKHFPDAR